MNLRPLLRLAAAGCTAPAPRPLAHRVLLLSIDGLRPDYVTEADAHGGPDVPHGLALGEVHMEQIAPTVAKLLGVPLPSAQEKPLLP